MWILNKSDDIAINIETGMALCISLQDNRWTLLCSDCNGKVWSLYFGEWDDCVVRFNLIIEAIKSKNITINLGDQ